MTDPTLSIIIGTSGRRTLSRTLASVTPQLQPGDEIVLPPVRRADEPVLRYSNVSTQTFFVPNVPGKLGRWLERPRPHDPEKTYAGDYMVVTETIALQGQEPVFVDEVTVYVRPTGRLRRLWARARYRAALGTRLRRMRGRPV